MMWLLLIFATVTAPTQGDIIVPFYKFRTQEQCEAHMKMLDAKGVLSEVLPAGSEFHGAQMRCVAEDPPA